MQYQILLGGRAVYQGEPTFNWGKQEEHVQQAVEANESLRGV